MQVQQFITQCIEKAGGVVETRAPNLLDVLLPPPLEAIGRGKSLLSLAVDTEALSVEPESELATIGSPLMDALIAFASARGTTAIGHILPRRLRKKGLREEIERALVFSNCRVRYDASEPDLRCTYYLQFNFRVTFLSEERRERIIAIPVNLWSNQPNLPLAEGLATLAVGEEKSMALLDTSRVSPEAAYETACRALRQQVSQEIAQHEARIKRRFVVEFSRISDYYKQVTQELQRRQEREEDEKRRHSLAQKVLAAQSERERKLRELGETYRLRLRAQLTSARLLSQPKTFTRVFLDRGQMTRTLSLAYDSVLERLEPPICEACRCETARVHVSSSTQVLCAPCAEGR